MYKSLKTKHENALSLFHKAKSKLSEVLSEIESKRVENQQIITSKMDENTSLSNQSGLVKKQLDQLSKILGED